MGRTGGRRGAALGWESAARVLGCRRAELGKTGEGKTGDGRTGKVAGIASLRSKLELKINNVAHPKLLYSRPLRASSCPSPVSVPPPHSSPATTHEDPATCQSRMVSALLAWTVTAMRS